MSNIAKPTKSFRPHGGPFKDQPVEEVVQSADGRAWLAGHVPQQPAENQRVALAWLSWSLQRQVTLKDLDQIAHEPLP